MKPGETYEAREGDSIDSIARDTGHLAKTIWDAPENENLRKKTRDVHILMKGDRVFIPPLESKEVAAGTGASHRFEVARSTPRLKLTIRAAGNARANEPYVLVVDGEERRGKKTDADGAIDEPIPGRARDLHLTVGEGDAATHFVLRARALPPVGEVAGAQARLQNLGYDVGPVDGLAGPLTKAALAAFQSDRGIDPSGKLDAATRSKLKEHHGC